MDKDSPAREGAAGGIAVADLDEELVVRIAVIVDVDGEGDGGTVFAAELGRAGEVGVIPDDGDRAELLGGEGEVVGGIAIGEEMMVGLIVLFGEVEGGLTA